MTQLSKALLSLTQDGQKGIPPCYGEKSLCCLRAKDKRRSIFLHFTCDKIVLNFRSYLDIVGNSSCYQIAEKRQYANWSQNSKWLFFRWPKGSRLVWEWPQRAIAFSKGFMRRQRTDKRSLILLQLIPHTRPKCAAKESVMKGFLMQICFMTFLSFDASHFSLVSSPSRFSLSQSWRSWRSFSSFFSFD